MDEEFQRKEEEFRNQLTTAQESVPAGTGNSEMMDQLSNERDDLIDQLSSLKREMYAAGNSGSEANAELQNKVEELVSALESAQQKNSELEVQVQELEASGGGGGEDNSGGSLITEGMSWEEQKAALLGETSKMTPLDRLTVDKAVQVTENAVAERDAEIAALKQQLASGGGGGGAAMFQQPVQAAAADPTQEPAFDADLEAERQAEIKKALQRAEEARAARDAEDARHNQQVPQRPRESRSLRDEMGL